MRVRIMLRIWDTIVFDTEGNAGRKYQKYTYLAFKRGKKKQSILFVLNVICCLYNIFCAEIIR